MKRLIAIMMSILIAAAHSSGREPGAAMSDAHKAADALEAADALKAPDALDAAEALKAVDALKAPDALKAADALKAVEQSEGGCSGLPPGALVLCIAEDAPTFATIDITIDPQGQPLGAYQFEMTSIETTFTVVGVEAGDHAAFDHGRPPYFDPVAKQGQTDRLILAQYAKPDLKANQLPTDAVRIATVHVMFASPLNEDEPPTIQLTLTAAGNADGQRIDADINHTFRTPERPE